jgi:hypothetical protein
LAKDKQDQGLHENINFMLKSTLYKSIMAGETRIQKQELLKEGEIR